MVNGYFDEEQEMEKVPGVKEKDVSTAARTRNSIARFLTTLFTLVLVYWFYLFAKWFFTNLRFEWLGYAIILTTLRTRIYTFMFCEAYHLSDRTSAVRRTFVPHDYFGRKFKGIDLVKLKFFMYDPYFMLRTDYKHSIPGHNLTNYINTHMYFRKIWVITVIQIWVGVAIVQGRLTEYKDELIMAWAIACFVGTLLAPIRNKGFACKFWYRTWGFPHITIPDVIYYMSLGYVRRGQKTPYRLLLSVIFMIVAYKNLIYGIHIDLSPVIEGGKKFWQSLFSIINPSNWT